MKTRILYLTHHTEIGGGETILLSLLEKLDRSSFSPNVVCPNQGTLAKRLESLKIPLTILPLPGYLLRTLFIPGMSPLGIYRFIKLIKTIKPDLIHLNHLNLAVYAGIAGKLLKIPVIATAHGPWDTIYFYQDLTTASFVDRILANTPELEKKLKKRHIIPTHKVQVLAFGIDTEKFKPRPKWPAKRQFGLNHNDIVISIVGRIDPVKDHLTFLRAANLIQHEFRNAKFFIIGSSLGDFAKTTDNNTQENKIKRFLKNHPALKRKVIITGFVEKMEEIYAATDILVSTSLSESFGLVLAEAQASGIPVVTTNVGGQRSVVKDGKTGFLVPPQKPNRIAAKVSILINDLKLHQTFSRNAQRHIERNFSLKTYVRRVEKLYGKIISTKWQ